MGFLMQGARNQQLERLQVIAQRLTRTTAPPPVEASQKKSTKPGWLLLCFDVCCLAGALVMTLNISWVFDHLPAGDPVVYVNYALLFWRHAPAFHEFPKEYPPLSLVPFSLTLVPYSKVHYYWVFAIWMGLLVCLSYIVFAWLVSRKKAMIYALYLLVGATGTLLMRFDLWPALATLAALMLAERKHYAWSYVLLAVGVLLKFYPAFLVPVVMAYQWRDLWLLRPPVLDNPVLSGPPGWRASLAVRWQALARSTWMQRRAFLHDLFVCSGPVLGGALLFVLLVVLGFLVPASLNLQGTISAFKYNFIRPIQIESVPSSLLWIGSFLGYPVRPNESFGSLNLVGSLDVYLKSLSLYALVGGMMFVSWKVLRGKLTLGEAFVATIALVLASNKLLSPQYLMWVLPLVAYVEGYDSLWLVICGLTTLIYPFIYQTQHPILTVPENSAFLPTITLRNALLVVATVRAVRGGQVQRDRQEDLADADLIMAGIAESEVPADLPVRTLNTYRRSDEDQFWLAPAAY